MSLSDNLVLLRAERQLTQRQLAEKAGIGIATVNRIEGGDYIPGFLTVEKLARALDVPVQELATPADLRAVKRAKKAAA